MEHGTNNWNLGEEIKQHSNAFANLAQRALRRCQINGLKAMIPDIEPVANPLPRGAREVGDGYVLLRARDNASRGVRQCEADAIKLYMEHEREEFSNDWEPDVVRWARLKLPNGQIARSAWKETEKSVVNQRISRNVQVKFIVGVRLILILTSLHRLLWTPILSLLKCCFTCC